MDIVFKDVSYIYQNNTPMASVGLQNINLTIHGGTRAISECRLVVVKVL